MEFNKIKICGCDVTAVFTGPYYYFHNKFYGWIAFAERTQYRDENGKVGFTIYVGGEHTQGGPLTDATVVAAVKRYITKEESQFVPAEVTYTVEKRPLHALQVSLNHNYAN